MSFVAAAVKACMFETTLSHDGTRIAYERRGSGAPIILVVGAFNERTTATPLAECLAREFSTITYDRRGRGDSGDAPTYSVEREIEDLAALIDVVGGSAGVFGYSSGALLALQSAAAGLAMGRLALYDPPYLVDTSGGDHTPILRELVATGRRGDAVEYFQREIVGIPADVVVQVRQAPFRPALERMAHTLVYESMILGDQSLPPMDAASRVSMPTLVLAGGAGPRLMPKAASAIGERLPNAETRVLPAESHDLNPAALGPLLASFFAE